MVAAATHAVLGLGPSARVCVLLHYYQGLSETAATTQLGIMVGLFEDTARGQDSISKGANKGLMHNGERRTYIVTKNN